MHGTNTLHHPQKPCHANARQRMHIEPPNPSPPSLNIAPIPPIQYCQQNPKVMKALDMTNM